jgi:hypothetical protein
MPYIFRRQSVVRHSLIGAALVLGLASCANPSQFPPDTPLSEIQAKLGAPNFSCQQPNGVRRLIWTRQPMGQYAWGANVGPDDRIDQLTPLLTDEHFKVLAAGSWTADQVRCEFGPPAHIDEVGLPSVREVVWAYRYRQDHVWNSLMYVYLGKNGDRVTRFHPGPDPLFDDDRRF